MALANNAEVFNNTINNMGIHIHPGAGSSGGSGGSGGSPGAIGQPGAHDISEDPAFVDFNNGDYHLQAGSPCRNTGYSGQNMPSDDLDGNSRPQGMAHDMGAYEYLEGPCEPVNGVTISGPTTGDVGVAICFTATVTPANATLPIDYLWDPVPDNQGHEYVCYTWMNPGTYVITVTASNCSGAGMAQDTHTITIGGGELSDQRRREQLQRGRHGQR